MDYYESLRFLYSLADFERTGRFADRKDVAPMLALLEELGNPHLGRTTVHIAGSKGKGSVAAMIESMLRAAGLTTGLTTSPHLHKIQAGADRQPAGLSDEFGAAAETVKQRSKAQAAAAGTTARDFRCDYGAGLRCSRSRRPGAGGRSRPRGLLDSTNVFEKKDVSVITNIGLEHREILGDTVAEIARQKAGIIIAGCPTVMAPQRESAADVIREVAAEKGSELKEVALVCNLRRDQFGSDSQAFRLRTPTGAYNVKLPLLGKHQLDNAATAILAVEALSASASGAGGRSSRARVGEVAGAHRASSSARP